MLSKFLKAIKVAGNLIKRKEFILYKVKEMLKRKIDIKRNKQVNLKIKVNRIVNQARKVMKKKKKIVIIKAEAGVAV